MVAVEDEPKLDPAADIAVAAALVSALADKPLPADSVWFGEVSLAGEVRNVSHAGLRLRESGKLGFVQAFGAEDPGPAVAGVRHSKLAMLPNLVDRIMGGA